MPSTLDWARLHRARDVGTALARRAALTRRERGTRDALLAYQRERVAELISDVGRRSRFYREHWGRALTAGVGLEALPPVQKAQLMARFDDAVTDGRLRLDDISRSLAALEHIEGDPLYLDEYRVLCSAGSSGKRGVFIYDKDEWRTFLAGVFRWMQLVGVRPGWPRGRVASVGAPDAKHMTYRGAVSVDMGLFRTLRVSASAPLAEIVERLGAHQPEYIMAYPSIAAMLAAEQLEGRLAIDPRVISTSSEVCTEEMRGLMRRAWGIEPFNLYALTETGLAAVDCEQHSGLHLFEDLCVIEIVGDDYRPVRVGEPGTRALVTNLFNRTLPMIRVEVSDILCEVEGTCACGRSLKRIRAVEGRSDDVLTLPGKDGGVVRVHPIHLRSALAARETVLQYRISLFPDEIEVELVLAKAADPAEVVASLERVLRERLAEQGAMPPPLRVHAVAEIAREPGAGKLKLVRTLPARSAAKMP